MHSDINSIVISGTLSSEVKTQTVGNHTKASAKMVVLKGVNKHDGSSSTIRMYIAVEAWNTVAERLQGFTEGSSLWVRGELKHEQWQTQDGTKKNRHVISVRELGILTASKNGNKEDIPF